MIPELLIWSFPERGEPLFEQAQAAEVREGNRVGGYLQATLLKSGEPISIGKSRISFDADHYQHIQLRARYEGKGEVRLEVNGVPLRSASGESTLANVFTPYFAALSGAAGWEGKAHLELRVHPRQSASLHPGERVIIDWMALAREPAAPSADQPAARQTEESTALALHRAWYHEASGMAFLYIQNRSESAMRLSGIEVDGTPEDLSIWPVQPERNVHWARCLPEVLPPGGTAEVRVSLRNPNPPRSRRIAVRMQGAGKDSDERIEVVLSGKQEALEFQEIAWLPEEQRLRIFVKGGEEGDAVQRVYWNGKEITVDLTAAVFHAGTAIIDWSPETPLTPGSRHLLEVTTAQGDYAIRSFRTFPGRFYLGVYGAATPEAFADYAAHEVDHYLGFRNLEPEQFAELERAGLSGGHQPAGSGVFKPEGFVPLDVERLKARVTATKAYDSLAYYSLPDEPDIWDYRAGSLGAHGRSMNDLATRHEALDPHRAVFVQVDNTYRSDNYRIYAPMVDMAASHTYLLGQHFLHEDRICMDELQRCVQPGRLLWVTQFYPLKAEQGEQVSYSGRFPTVEEMHLQMLSALGYGAKGILHYMHSASQGGRGGAGRHLPLWDGLTPLHRQIREAGRIAAVASPVQWPRSATPGLTVDLLSAGRDALLVVVINEQFSSRKEGFSLTPIRHAEITVTLPPWMQIGAGTEILPNGEAGECGWSIDDGKLKIALSEIQTGKILLLKAR